jgi:hypothetical protein
VRKADPLSGREMRARKVEDGVKGRGKTPEVFGIYIYKEGENRRLNARLVSQKEKKMDGRVSPGSLEMKA